MTGRAQLPTIPAADLIGGTAVDYVLPAHDGTVWLGLRPAGLGCLAATVTLAVAGLVAGLPAPAAVGVLLPGTVVALLPVGGRTPIGWLPILLGHQLRRTAGWTGPLGPWVRAASNARREARVTTLTRVVLPPECERRQLRSLPIDAATGPGRSAGLPATRDIGLLVGPNQPVTVVFAVTGTDRFALLEPAAQDAQLARWGTALTALAADPHVRGVQWLTSSRSDLADAGTWMRHHQPGDGATDSSAELSVGAPADRLIGSAMVRDYLEMTARMGEDIMRHTHLLAVRLMPPPAVTAGRRTFGRPPVRGSSPEASPAAVDAALVDQVRDVAAVLLTADLLPHPLTMTELGLALRQLTDLRAPDSGDDSSTGASAAAAFGIRSRRRRWDYVQTDDTVHRSYAVTGWPRLALPADWLAPVLLAAVPAGTARTLSVHLQPVAPQVAVRRARAARAKARLDAADRGRLGFGGTPGDALAEADAAALEGELLAGFRLQQVTAVVTVSAPTLQRLAAASEALRGAAASHRIDLRPQHGQHDLALAATLPLAVLPGRRGSK